MGERENNPFVSSAVETHLRGGCDLSLDFARDERRMKNHG